MVVYAATDYIYIGFWHVLLKSDVFVQLILCLLPDIFEFFFVHSFIKFTTMISYKLIPQGAWLDLNPGGHLPLTQRHKCNKLSRYKEGTFYSREAVYAVFQAFIYVFLFK